MDPLIHNSKTNLKLPPFQAAELLIKVSVAAKKYIYRYRNLNIFFFYVCILSTIADMSCSLLSYDRGLLRFQRCFRHIHRQFYTRGDSHANTRTQAHIRTFQMR